MKTSKENFFFEVFLLNDAKNNEKKNDEILLIFYIAKKGTILFSIYIFDNTIINLTFD